MPQPERAYLRFPILTFEEAALSPSLGYVFDPKWAQPCESIVSLLWKFARANALPGHLVVANLAPKIDPYDGVKPIQGEIQIKRLRRMLPVSSRYLRSSFFPSALARAMSPLFRYCPPCLHSGYHSILFQLEIVSTCPIHKRWLEKACRCCGHLQTLRLNARLLDRPFRCAECGKPYASSVHTPSNHKPLSRKARLLISRSHYRYWFR